MLYLVLTGATLGLSAGISPGPLLTLVIYESLRGGWPAGFRVALAPLITDSLLIAAALLLIAPLPPAALSWISLVGGGVLVWMGWAAIRDSRSPAPEGRADSGRVGPLGRGILTNLLNPHAILFWVTNGGPLIRSAFAEFGTAGAAGFLAVFFTLLVGSKIGVAVAVGSGRRFVQGAGYRLVLALSGGALLLFGLWRAWEGVLALAA